MAETIQREEGGSEWMVMTGKKVDGHGKWNDYKRTSAGKVVETGSSSSIATIIEWAGNSLHDDTSRMQLEETGELLVGRVDNGDRSEPSR